MDKENSNLDTYFTDIFFAIKKDDYEEISKATHELIDKNMIKVIEFTGKEYFFQTVKKNDNELKEHLDRFYEFMKNGEHEEPTEQNMEDFDLFKTNQLQLQPHH